MPELTDVNSDQQDKGLETDLIIDRDTAARLGLNVSQIDNTLYDAFGQRQVSTIYNRSTSTTWSWRWRREYWQKPETLEATSIVSTVRRRGRAARSRPTRSAGTCRRRRGTAAQLGTATRRRRRGAQSRPPTAHRQHRPTAAPRPAPRSAPAAETMVPLAAFSHYGPGTTPLAVNHQGPFVATTISFNLPPGIR